MSPEDDRRATGRHRWPFAVGGVLIVLAVLASAWWFLWVPNWRPPLREGEQYGVDVSAHQNHIDWPQVAGDGIDFAYIKASEGGDFVDRRFGENWRGAGEAGLDRGAYHFFSLCTPGLVQARNFLAVASPDPTALAPAVDLELAGNCGERPDAAVVDTELGAFLRLVEDAWRTEVVLYVGDDFEARYGVRRGVARPLWHRRFLVRPDDDWQIWQVHGYARVDGVLGRVDLDLRRPVA